MRRWRYDDEKTKIDEDGFIEVIVEDEPKIIVLNETSGEVEYETKVTPILASKSWKFVLSNVNKKWGIIQHAKSGLYLTARYRNQYRVLTAENKGNAI